LSDSALTSKEIREMVAAVTDRAETEGLRVVIAVVDAAGRLVGLHVMAGAFLTSTNVAIAKAFTAANFGAATADLSERIRLETRQELASVDSRLVFIRGGVPIERRDRLAGGVGVSGASAEQDEVLARHAIATVLGERGGVT
jgi:glc operon protein GlcG